MSLTLYFGINWLVLVPDILNTVKKIEVKVYWGQFDPKVFLLDPNFTLAQNNPRGNANIVIKHSIAKRIIFFILLN